MVPWLRITCQRRGHEFNPWFWKTPRESGQLSLCGTASEPTLRNKRIHCGEKPVR